MIFDGQHADILKIVFLRLDMNSLKDTSKHALCSPKWFIRLAFIVLIVLFPFSTKSQTPGNIDVKQIEYLLKLEIDSVRQSKGLDILINDSILYLASIDQSRYLSKKKELTHFQKENPKKLSPQDRAEFYGAINYQVGENVLYITYNYSTSDQDPDDICKAIAHSMMLLWVHSPGHYANIITPSYDITGVSVYYDENTDKLFAAQVFAHVNPYYRYRSCPSLFPYEKYDESLASRKFIPENINIEFHKRHAFNIKQDKEKNKCCSDEKTSVFNYNSTCLGYFNDSLYLGINKKYFSAIHQFFKNRKDGVVLEFLDFDYTYSCNILDNTRIPTRDNGGCVFNGQITHPVYRDSILYYMDKYKKQYTKNNEFIFIPIDRYPSDLSGKTIDINILILQKNRLCKVIQTHGVCGVLIEPEIPEFKLHVDLDSTKYRADVRVQKKEFKVYFNKNEIDIINPDTLYFLRDMLKKEDVFVSKINVDAYASVEGSYEINQYLYTKRAENILRIFQSEQDSSIELTTKTEENWAMFFNQLKTSDYAYLLNSDTARIKDSVNVPQNAQKLEGLLSQQRYGQVTIYYKPKITNQNTAEYAFAEFKKICRIKKPEGLHINKLRNITSFLLYQCMNNKIELDSIEFYLNSNSSFIDSKQQILLFKEIYRDGSGFGPDSTYRYLANYSASHKNDTTARYNCLAYLFNNRRSINNAITPSLAQEFLEILKTSHLSKEDLISFELYFHFIYLNDIYYKKWTFKSIEKHLAFIDNFYTQNPPDDDLRIKLALYFISFNQFLTSLEYLEPLITEDHFIKEAYILYLKLYDQLQMAGLRTNSEELLIEAADKLSNEDWCNLFIGPCNIRFQIFNHSALRSIYCEKCNSKK